jgi:peptidoglycan hydrolase CwlO-like protein
VKEVNRLEATGVNILEQAVQKRLDDMDKDIKELQRITSEHSHDIREIKSSLNDIKDDTKWVRRTLTNAFLTAIIMSVVGGMVGLLFFMIKQ